MSYHDAFQQGLDAGFLRDPDGLHLYMEILQRMNSGYFAREYIDVFLQHWNARRYDVYDAWVFGQLHALAVSRELQILELPIGHEPGADTAAAINNQRLASLPEPFMGQFWGGSADFDGEIEWNDDVFVGDQQRHWSPSTAPLEVGSTRPATTWLHLRRSSRLARWPYGSTSVYVLDLTREAWEKHFTVRRLLPVSLPIKRSRAARSATRCRRC